MPGPISQRQTQTQKAAASGKPASLLGTPLLAVLVACAFIALFVGYEASKESSIPQCLLAGPQPSSLESVNPSLSPSLGASGVPSVQTVSPTNTVKLKLPAVDSHDNGALADLLVEAAPGNGLVFMRFDSSNPLVDPDTQTSLRTALAVAKKIVGEDNAVQKNLFYTLSAPSDVVGGSSAGAAFTIAAIFALEGAALKENVLITGAIESDGSIGQVGKILAKARAVKDAGYTVFLVPTGESKQTVSRESCKDATNGGRSYKDCSTVSELVDVGQEVGIQVIEVKDIVEAYSLMRKD